MTRIILNAGQPMPCQCFKPRFPFPSRFIRGAGSEALAGCSAEKVAEVRDSNGK